MVAYRRNIIPGVRYFFTVTLADHASALWVDPIADLRAVFGAVRAQRPYTLDAVVVLPDHLHCVWTLPPGDADDALRWRDITLQFSRRRTPAGQPRSIGRVHKGERAFGNGVIGSIPCVTSVMRHGILITSITTLSNTGRYPVWRRGPILRTANY